MTGCFAAGDVYKRQTLYTMYQDELLTGSYDYPEEA